MQSYSRGSVDNITVLVIVFRNGVYRIGDFSAAAPTTAVANVAAKQLLNKPAAAVSRSNSGVGVK